VPPLTDDEQPDDDHCAAALLDYSVEDLYENAPCGYLSSYPDGRIARVNRTFLSWTGYQREDLVGVRRVIDLLTAGGRIYHETHYAPLLRMQGSVRAIAMDLVRANGSSMPVLVNSLIRIGEDGRPLAVRTTIFDATDRKEYETELLAARRRAEQATTWVRAVEQVVAELAAVSGVDEVAEVVARAGTFAFAASASVLWMADPTTGVLRWTAGSGDLGPRADLPRAADALPHFDALRTGQVVQVTECENATVSSALRAALGSGLGELVLVPLAPLVAREHALGVLVLRLAPSRAPEPEELRLLQTLGNQAGQALERARLYDQERSVATTLQHSMLPGALPDDPRLALSTCYQPAVDALEVGGDWYDAFLLDADRVAVVVGDVVGRGLNAAAVMGQLRSAIRALAMVDSGPALLLERLDRFVEGVPAADTATMAYAEVDLRDGTTRYACAGHPPPVLVDPAGRPVLLWDGRSAPLGAHFGVAARPEASVTLTDGARLVLYTDGLVERRDEPLDQSIDALAELLGNWAHRPFATMAEGVTEAMLGSEGTGDDVCLLALAYREHPTFTRAVPADTSRISRLRADLTHWLQTQGVIGEDHDATLLACSEAVANAIEHGYPDEPDGVVEVLATISPGGLWIRIRDRGRWRPPGVPGDRGRGLRLVRAAMDQVSIDHRAGTVVTMHRTIAEGRGA
jgi:PAS domain S-box-containing protein